MASTADKSKFGQWTLPKITSWKLKIYENWTYCSCSWIVFVDIQIVSCFWNVFNINVLICFTYLPHKAVAEVSKDKEPIGRECAEFNWFESQLMSDSSEVRFKWCGLSSDLRFKWFWLSTDLRFKWFGCQSMCASNDFGCLLFWTSSDVVVNWFEIQVIRLSIDLRFKWFGCQSIWDSN